MGLVTCSKCKKIYDYDKYSGICPKCARYNKETMAAVEHQEYHNKYDGGYRHTAKDDHYSFHEKYDDNRNPHVYTSTTVEKQSDKKKMDKRTKIILGVIILIFAINFILPFLGAIFSMFFLW